MAAPTYLRAIVTGRCPLTCTYCHMEGDAPGASRCVHELCADEWIALLRAAVANGVRKLKLLGGEPLLRGDLPEIIDGLRQASTGVDISLITSGVVDPARLDRCFEAGLARANMSIQGFGQEAFARHGGTRAGFELRARFLEALLRHARPVKLNFVYSVPGDRNDLAALLEWAAAKRVVVNVLDDLGREDLGAAEIERLVYELRGPSARVWGDEDPDSLSTRHLRWRDGLEVEIKDQHLGELAPWHACADCPLKARCKEGIHALRVSRTGVLRACMDRPELGIDLTPVLARRDDADIRRAWRAALQRLAGPRPARQERTVPASIPA